MTKAIAPYGAWVSPVTVELMTEAAVGLSGTNGRRRRSLLARSPAKREGPHGFMPPPREWRDRRPHAAALLMSAAAYMNMAAAPIGRRRRCHIQRAHRRERLAHRGWRRAAPDRNARRLPLRRFRIRSCAPPRARRAGGPSRPPADRSKGRDRRLAARCGRGRDNPGRGSGFPELAAAFLRWRTARLDRLGSPRHALGQHQAFHGRCDGRRRARNAASGGGRNAGGNRAAGVVGQRNALFFLRSDRLVEPLCGAR